MQPDEPSAEPPAQLPLWADEPPKEAASLLDLIERLQRQLGVPHGTASASTVRARLQRLAIAMETGSFEQSQSMVLLPHFTGDNYKALERTILVLAPKPEELAEVEQAVEAASADPENRKLVARIAERLPSRAQVAKMTPWAVLVMVSLELLKVAPEINPNDIGALTMILMVELYLLPPRSGP